MFYRLAHELIRKNRNGSSDRALICEVRLGRVIVLLADGGRETFSVEHGAGWSYAPGTGPGAGAADRLPPGYRRCCNALAR